MAKKLNSRLAAKAAKPRPAARAKPPAAKPKSPPARRARKANNDFVTAAVESAAGFVVVDEPTVQIVAESAAPPRGTRCATFADARELALDLLLERIESGERQLAQLKRSATYAEYAEQQAAEQ